MTFKRKHYEEIARLFRKTNDLQQLKEWIIKYFKADNEKFDEQRFRQACQRVENGNIWKKLWHSNNAYKRTCTVNKGKDRSRPTKDAQRALKCLTREVTKTDQNQYARV